MVASPRPCEAPHARPGVPRRRRASAGRSATGTIAPSAPAYTHGDTSPVRTRDSTSRAEHAGSGPVPPSPGGAADSATSPPTAASRAGPASSGQWQEVPPLRPPGIGWRSTGRCRLGCYYGSQTRRSGAGGRYQGMGEGRQQSRRGGRPGRAAPLPSLSPLPCGRSGFPRGQSTLCRKVLLLLRGFTASRNRHPRRCRQGPAVERRVPVLWDSNEFVTLQ